ncbi:MAG: MFS transporter, partial [Patescibacteria group bacterium]
NEIIGFLKRNRHFVFLWGSHIMSVVTINIINFVLITRIFEKTGSTLAISFLWIFYFLPSFFLGPFSGMFVDHLDKRKILIFTNVLQSLVVLLLLLVRDEIYPIYPIVFLYSLVDEFYVPAQASAIPSLVKKEDLPLANSLLLLTSQSSLILGVAISGILIRLFGYTIPILISSLLLLIAAIIVQSLPIVKTKGERFISSLSNYWEEIKAGYFFIKGTRLVLFPLLLITVFQIFMSVFGVTIPVFANNLLQIQVQDAGPLLVIPLGLGALSGVLIMTRNSGKLRKRSLMKYGFIIAFFVMALMATVLPLMGSYKTLMAIPLMYFLGMGGLFIYISNQTLVQERTPENLRGRVFGTLGVLIHLATLPCLLFTSTIVDFLGIRVFTFLAAMLVLAMFLSFDRIEQFILLNKSEKINKQVI